MALLEWSKDYDTHIRVIDTDHQNLFDAINTLHDAHLANKGRERIGSVIETLRHYVVEHFEREEHFLEQAGYPDFVAHCAAHRDFSQLTDSLVTLYQQNPDLVDISKVIDFLGHWLTEHILKTDMQYVPYMRGEKQGIPREQPDQAKEQNEAYLTFTVPRDKADVITSFVDTVIGGDHAAESFEKAFRAAQEQLNQSKLARARKLFGLE